jgi:hypothetical protein
MLMCNITYKSLKIVESLKDKIELIIIIIPPNGITMYIISGMVVNGFVNVVITTIERRFGMRSRETGLMAGGYDIASFLCLVPVSYLGGRPGASKPRWLGWGVLLMGLG